LRKMSFHRWKEFCETSLQLHAKELVHKWWFEIIEPLMRVTDKRPYHNLNHVTDLIAWSDRFSVGSSIPVQLSIYFHDVIYDPSSKESNEERSAKLFKAFAEESRACTKAAWTSPDCVEDVYAWIIETSRHTSTRYVSPFAQKEFHLFLDFDMSILGASRERYAKYAKDVRLEYIHIDDAAFLKGRSTFLRSLALVPDEELYKTKDVRDMCLDQARRNVAWELSCLVTGRL
jgi:predicted metal-dependent HD superfamily phosphohydrolase